MISIGFDKKYKLNIWNSSVYTYIVFNKKMKNITFIFILLIPFFGHPQSSNVLFKSRVNYLPTSDCLFEYYIIQKDKSFHYFKKKSDDCYSPSLKKKKKDKNIEIFEAIDYIINKRNIENILIPIVDIKIDSIVMIKLKALNKIKNDSLIFNFKEFKESYYQADSTKLGIILPRFEGHQIDGNRLMVELIVESDTVFSINIGNRESPKTTKSREWLLFYNVYHEYHLFNKLMLDNYFSKEKYLNLIQVYIKEITKHKEN